MSFLDATLLTHDRLHGSPASGYLAISSVLNKKGSALWRTCAQIFIDGDFDSLTGKLDEEKIKSAKLVRLSLMKDLEDLPITSEEISPSSAANDSVRI